MCSRRSGQEGHKKRFFNSSQKAYPMIEGKGLWRSMWISPKSTIRYIVKTDVNHQVFLLTILGGIGQVLSNASARSLGDVVSVPTIFLMAITLGPLSGFITLYLGGMLIHWTSRLFRGSAAKSEIRAAIAWSWIPIATLLPLWIVKYILFRDELFLSDKEFIHSQNLLSTLNSIAGFIDLFVAVWTFFLLYISVSEVNHFSHWRGFAAVILAGLILAIPFVLFIMFVNPRGVPL
jgi:hypothetical protein